MNANNDEVKQHWISVDDRLPEPLRNVLVLIDGNTAKNMNQMVANFIPKFTEEAGHEDWYEYCEEKDLFYCPQGWYANTAYIGDECSSYFIDEEVTHWMPLPAPPAQKETICCECNDPFIFKRGSTTEDTCERCVLEYVTSHCDY